MNQIDKNRMVPLEDVLLEELEEAERKNPGAFYQARLTSVKVGRKLGFTDDELEEALGIKLKPEDRVEHQEG